MSGGTAFTPLNLRANSPNNSTCNAYVGTDVTAATKTTGGSLEVYRGQSIELNTGDATHWVPSWEYRPAVYPVLVGPASFLLHWGAGTADMTGYGSIQWLEVPSNSVT